MKRLLTLFLALLMLVTCIPVNQAYAEGAQEDVSLEEILSETVPEEVVPEETVSEEIIPEETIAEEAIPEETVSEEIIPEETVAEEVIPEEVIPEEPVSEEPVAEEPAVAEEITFFTGQFSESDPIAQADNEDLFAAYVDSVFFPNQASLKPTYGTARAQLSSDQKKLYDGICWLFKELASGNRSYAYIVIGNGQEYDVTLNQV